MSCHYNNRLNVGNGVYEEKCCAVFVNAKHSLD